MKVNTVEHICIAVENIDDARKVWEPLLGKTAPDETFVDEPEKIRIARYSLGGVSINLMESTSPDGKVAEFIEEHGEGIMLIGLNVDNTRQAITELEAKGYPFIPDARGEEARPFRSGEHAFLLPKKINGVLAQLIDYKWKK